jgi:hypothetical protein
MISVYWARITYFCHFLSSYAYFTVNEFMFVEVFFPALAARIRVDIWIDSPTEILVPLGLAHLLSLLYTYLYFLYYLIFLSLFGACFFYHRGWFILSRQTIKKVPLLKINNFIVTTPKLLNSPLETLPERLIEDNPTRSKGGTWTIGLTQWGQRSILFQWVGLVCTTGSYSCSAG